MGVPALRIKGLFLAVTTLAFAIALDNYFLNPNNFPQFVKTSVKRPLLWERFDLSDNYAMYLVTLTFLVIVDPASSIGVRKARSGRVAHRARGTTSGQPTRPACRRPTMKLSGFLLAGAIAGVAGGLHVMAIGGLAVGTFNPADSITVFSTAVIGGLGSITGAILGVLLFRYLETLTFLGRAPTRHHRAGLLVVLYLLPGGLGQLPVQRRATRRLRWVADAARHPRPEPAGRQAGGRR